MMFIKKYDREYRQYLRENPDSLLTANFELISAIHQLYKLLVAKRVIRILNMIQNGKVRVF